MRMIRPLRCCCRARGVQSGRSQVWLVLRGCGYGRGRGVRHRVSKPDVCAAHAVSHHDAARGASTDSERSAGTGSNTGAVTEPRPLQFDTRGVPMLPDNPTPEESEQVLMADLDQGGIPHSTPSVTAGEAQDVCSYLASGHHTRA
jgi:hypothetical protein